MSDDQPRVTPQDLQSHQANERTMLAWIRTGIALMAFGFAVARFGVFLRSIAIAGHVVTNDHSLESGTIGIAMVVLGTATHVVAIVRYVRVRDSIRSGCPASPGPVAVYLLGGIAAAAALLMALLLAHNALR